MPNFASLFSLPQFPAYLLNILERVVPLFQVFGADKRYWLIPAYSDEDIRRMPALQGIEYPSKPDFDSQEF